MKKVVLTDCMITLEDYMAVVRGGAELEFSDQFRNIVNTGRALIDRFLAEDRIIYGVTTGFGDNVRHVIDPDDAVELQKRIVRSHSVAVGEPLKREQCRAIMLQTILNGGKGQSGICLSTLEVIRSFLNEDIVPWAPGEGSVGYLAVEGHFVMAYIGEGFVIEDGKKVPALGVMKAHGIEPVTLQCKEGLCMLNGTITVTALAVIALYDVIGCMKNAEVVGGILFEALRGTTKALDPRIHQAKNHAEEIASAANLRKLLEGSEIAEKYRDAKVQDSYIMRAMPQMHGACRRLVKEAYDVIMEEVHGCSDNPELFVTSEADSPDGLDGVAIMCGNFDGTYVGSHADMLSQACAIMGNVVNTGMDRLVSRHLSDGLPAFLAPNPGLNNGFMIPQYTTAGLESELRILAQPSTVDNVTTCANQEDPVSMAYFASKKAGLAAKKLYYMIAIEYMTALQAVDFLKPLKQSPALAKVHDHVREQVPFFEEDEYFHPYIEKVHDMTVSGELVDIAEEAVGKLEF